MPDSTAVVRGNEEGFDRSREEEIERLLEASDQFQGPFSLNSDGNAENVHEKDSEGDAVMLEAAEDSASLPKTSQVKKVSPLDDPDEATKERVIGIVKKELESELEYKASEVALIESRLSEVETLLEKLRACTEGGRGRGRRQYVPENAQQETRGSKLFAIVDDKFVQLVCPACQRVKFNSQAGFTNHCRKLHQLRFATTEDAVIFCGLPVADSDIPLEDPVRTSIPLVSKRGRGNGGTKERKIAKGSEGASPSGGEASVVASNSPTTSIRATMMTEMAMARTEAMGESDAVEERKKRSDDERKSEKGRLRGPTRGPMRTVMAIDSVASEVSRFYVKMRVYIGNTSKHIPEALRPPGDMSTHKWMVYVRGPERDPDVSHFVQKVRFFLHPSFKPNDVVEVTAQPFRIVRKGWGEFPVRVQLFFHSKKTKPVDYIHQLKLDHKNLGLAVLGLERPVDVEIDREFFVSKQHELESMRTEESGEEEDDDQEEDTTKASSTPVLPAKAMRPEVKKSIRHLSSESEETQVEVEKLLRNAQETYALISSSAYSLPYAIAATKKEWNSWNIGKRRSSEWQRAKRVRQMILRDTGIDVSTKAILVWYRVHGFAPNPSTVVIVDQSICDVPPTDESALGPTPPPGEKKSYTVKALNRLCFCKFCGALHTPLEDFMTLQRDCSKRQKATTISSWSPCPVVLAPPSLLGGLPTPSSTLCEEPPDLSSFAALRKELDARAYHASHVKLFPFIRQALSPLGLVLDRRPSVKPLTESILLIAMLRFLKELIYSAAQVCRNQEVDSIPDRLALFRVLVPVHVFKAICNEPHFDFLTNAGLLRPRRAPE